MTDSTLPFSALRWHQAELQSHVTESLSVLASNPLVHNPLVCIYIPFNISDTLTEAK